MVDFSTAIATIKDNNGFKPNVDDSSFYRVYVLNNKHHVQVRISNHGTHLWTWQVKAEYLTHNSDNISIVFMSSSEGSFRSNTKVNMNIYGVDKKGRKKVVGKKPSFEVVQYVYDCDVLTVNNIARINKAIQNIPIVGKFVDPFTTNIKKHADVYRLTPNNIQELMTEEREKEENNFHNSEQIS